MKYTKDFGKKEDTIKTPISEKLINSVEWLDGEYMIVESNGQDDSMHYSTLMHYIIITNYGRIFRYCLCSAHNYQGTRQNIKPTFVNSHVKSRILPDIIIKGLKIVDRADWKNAHQLHKISQQIDEIIEELDEQSANDIDKANKEKTSVVWT